MRLAKVATFFDRTPCCDAYTGVYLFNAQFALFDDVKRDSEAAERRVLSMSSACTIPHRRVVLIDGSRYILGHGTPDYFNGTAIRTGYVAHEANLSAQVRTLAQACRGQLGSYLWSAKFQVKTDAFQEQDSAIPEQVHLHFGATESVAPNQVITLSGRHYLVRRADIGSAGTLIVMADEQPGGPVAATLSGGSYDPVADTMTNSSVSITVMRLRWQSLFAYGAKPSPTFGPDDDQFAIAKLDATPVPGASVVLSSGTWVIASVESLDDVWLCRGTRHA